MKIPWLFEIIFTLVMSVGIFSCLFSQNNLHDAKYINTILDYMEHNNLQYLHSATGICNYINEHVSIDKSSCNYAYWNFVYYSNYVNDSISTFNILRERNSEIDFGHLSDLLNFSFELNQDQIETNMCSEIVDNSSGKGSIYNFSPMIKMDIEDSYLVWLTINQGKEPVNLSFNMAIRNSELEVVNHTYSNSCHFPSTVIIGDYIETTSAKKMKTH